MITANMPIMTDSEIAYVTDLVETYAAENPDQYAADCAHAADYVRDNAMAAAQKALPLPIPLRKDQHDCAAQPVPPDCDWFEVYYCPDCDALNGESGGSLYECNECGGTFTRASAGGNRCPDCNKFARKIAEFGCYDCESAETYAVMAYECPMCGDLVMAGDSEQD